MTRRLLAGYLTITGFAVLVLGLPLGVVFARLERSHLIAGVRQDATALALFAVEPLRTGAEAALVDVASDYQRRTGGRVVIVDQTGVARADSDPAEARESFARRPEVAGALEGKPVQGFRTSKTAGGDLFYVAVPVNSGGVLHGVVRVTHPAGFVNDRIRRTWLLLGTLGAVMLAAATLVSRAVATSVTAPLRRLAGVAAEIGDGRLDSRVPLPSGPPELRLVSRVFNDTAAKLERLVEAQRTFVADASHQLRTPLAALRLRLEVAERQVAGEPKEDVQAALAEAHRLSRLVEGLLALAAADHHTPARGRVDAAAVVAERRENWAPLAEEQGVRLVAQLRPAAVLLTAGVLEQLLDNLIANALEASPAGSVTTLAVVPSTDWVDVHVIDQGRGMSAEQRAEAFVRRWRPPGRRLGGSGLGLAIVHRLVESDGGEISLGDAAGGGLDVHLRLPRTRPERRHLAPAAQPNSRSTSPR